MCYDLYHVCRYCNNQYECSLDNYICPTINRDVDERMCDICRAKEASDYKKWLDETSSNKSVSIDDWENK